MLPATLISTLPEAEPMTAGLTLAAVNAGDGGGELSTQRHGGTDLALAVLTPTPAEATPLSWYGAETYGPAFGRGAAARMRRLRWTAALPAEHKRTLGDGNNKRTLVRGDARLPDDGLGAGRTVSEYVQAVPAPAMPPEIRVAADKKRQHWDERAHAVELYRQFRRDHPNLAPSSEEFAREFERVHGDYFRAHNIGLSYDRLAVVEKKWLREEPLDGRAGHSGRKPIECTPEAWELFRSLYLHRNSLKLSHCWRYVRGEARIHGWNWPALTTIYTRVQRTFPRGAILAGRGGPRRLEADGVPKDERNYEDIAAGDWWVLDGRTLNSTIRVHDDRREWREARPVLIGLLDMRSRSLQLELRATECCDGVLAVVKRGLLGWGAPTDSIFDNGEAFKAGLGNVRGTASQRAAFNDPRIGSVFGKLGVTVHNTIPYHPWAKQIESIWRKLKEGFDRWLWHFRGGSPAERPEGRCAAIRHRIDDLPTEAECREYLQIWLDEYHATEQSGQGTRGLCPNLVMEQYRQYRRKVTPDEADLLCRRLLLKNGRPRAFSLARDGVRYNCVRYGRWDEEVWHLKVKQVALRIDPDKLDQVTFCNVQTGVELCTAHASHQLAGTTQEHRREVAKKQARYRRAMKEYLPARDYLAETPTRQLLEAKRAHAQADEAAARAKLPPAEPPAVTYVRPDLAAAAKELKAKEQRSALRRTMQPAAQTGSETASEAVLDPYELLKTPLREKTQPAEATECAADLLKGFVHVAAG